jgi:hypothetical protein
MSASQLAARRGTIAPLAIPMSATIPSHGGRAPRNAGAGGPADRIAPRAKKER